MLIYKKLQEELGGKEKTDKSVSLKSKVIAFGRMNPPTVGHEQVVNKVRSVAKEHGADHAVILSHSHDPKKNPLSPEQKVTHARNAFSGTNITAASKEHPTILHHAAKAHAAGVNHLHVVAGSDRHQAMHDLLHKYNGQHAAHGHYNFKSITMHSSGERDPDSEGTSGISGSKMREHAASGNKAEFHKGAPSTMSTKHKDAMYNDVRKGMSLKEETKEQQDDRAAQLKRFKDQMTKANGPKKDTELGLDKKEKEAMVQVQEVLRPDMGAGAYINDFIKSTHPRFNNKSRAERRRMAIGAYMAAKANGMKEEVQIDEISDKTLSNYVTAARKDREHNKVNKASPDTAQKVNANARDKKRIAGMNKANSYLTPGTAGHNKNQARRAANEEVQIDELSTDLLGKYKTAAHASAKAADASGNYAKGDKRFKGINKATNKQFDNDLKKHGQMKEGTIQTNGTDKIETSTSAPSASTAKDTTMGKKIKGFKFFSGENDKQMNMNQPIKEAKDEKEYGYEGDMAMNQLKTLVRCAEMIEDCLKPDTDLPEWVQSKITLATDYIQTAADYLYSEAEVKEGYSSYSGRSHGHAYGGGGFGKREREDDEYHVPDPTPVAPTVARKYIKGTPENKAAKAASKPINGHPTNEEVLDEKSDQARRNKTMKNMLDTIRGAKFKLNNPVPDTDHKTAQEKNKAIGRALRNESMTGNPGKGYHGACGTADEKYEEMHKHVKNLTDGDDKTVKHYLDSGHGEKLAGREEDHDHIKSDFNKFMKYYRPEMNDPKPAVKEETAPVGKPQKVALKTAVIKLHPKGVASDTEEGWAKPKIKEETMKSYKEFLQALDEKLIGGQKKLDKNKNGKLDKQDFEMLRKEETENLTEYETDKNGRYVHKGKSYGADYEDPEGAFETKKDMKKPEKAGRKAGAGAGVYKPRATMSKLKSAGATYK